MKIVQYFKSVFFFISLLFLLLTNTLYSQGARIDGKVIDATNNEPLPFANVLVKGTSIGATTDFDGKFSITGLEPGFVTLEATYVGYRNQTSAEILLSATKKTR